MSYGQGGPPSQWDPWKPQSPQPWNSEGGSGSGQAPDWAALADASETRHKRRRLLLIGGGAIATVAIGTAVAVAVVSANGSDQASGPSSSQLPATAGLPSATGTVPSFAPTSAPPPLDPKDFVSSVQKDRAPLGPDVLFPGTQLTMGDTVYKKGPTADTRNCASAAKATLPKVLTDNECSRLLRVTYTKDDIAVTVGVAVFDTEAQAAKAKQQADAKSIVKSLAGGGVKGFCDGAVCRSTTNSYGRYAYFTLSGFTDAKNVTEQDKAVFSTGNDLAEFTFRQIRRRGEAQASAAANE
ncbi:hypothetical protein [Streptomyces sp. KMM 9044]|uniref:hypothetical protein n=1 Tax=Streptomyces sp. KMM 9044 TaxID=2744474 RepID=UPI0021507ECB|nr:hypothetical protein [Streptomyces sp. KMM 9044]WAX78449.1 hypothetical protein HUV60_012955 [Streptomyces sp. KMM 9044]